MDRQENTAIKETIKTRGRRFLSNGIPLPDNAVLAPAGTLYRLEQLKSIHQHQEVLKKHLKTYEKAYHQVTQKIIDEITDLRENQIVQRGKFFYKILKLDLYSFSPDEEQVVYQVKVWGIRVNKLDLKVVGNIRESLAYCHVFDSNQVSRIFKS